MGGGREVAGRWQGGLKCIVTLIEALYQSAG